MSRKDNVSEIFGQIVSEAFTEASRECCTSALATAVAPTESEMPAEDEQVAWFSIRFDGSLQGRAFLAVKQADIAALGLRDEADAPEAETVGLMRLMQTTASRLQELAATRYGPGTATVEQESRPTLSPVSFRKMSTQPQDVRPAAALYLGLESQLVAKLQNMAGELFPDAVPSGQTSIENLGLVLDVELNATLRFGQRQLTLREILELTSGSVVELDRQVDEPVELVLDGRVIARGEAVIIDGNYGMRITEVLQAVEGISRSR